MLHKNPSRFYRYLKELEDPTYKVFQEKLVPTLPADKIRGIRIPHLRSLAKDIKTSEPDQVQLFMQEIPHAYFEEDNLHGLLISEQQGFQETLQELEHFLPFVDNWATCDLIRPKAFKKLTQDQRTLLLDAIGQWIVSSHEYTVRFGIEMLLVHYLKEGYDQAHLYTVAHIELQTYYVDMMKAWYFATALVDHYDDVMLLLKSDSVSPWIHNKTIQKARESYRVPNEHKVELKTLVRPATSTTSALTARPTAHMKSAAGEISDGNQAD